MQGNVQTSMPEKPRFSVVATVRNERDGISAFVGSLLEQDLPPDEIIIVDGGSTDGTQEILREYSEAGKIALISRESNIAQGRNVGIREARNDYIAVTDAGCIVDRAWLARLARCFLGSDHPDVVAGNYRFDCRSPFEEAVVLGTSSPDREDADEARYYPSSRSVAFRKAAWEDAKGYPEWLYAAEDTLFNIRLRQLGKRFSFCREAIVRWRPRSTWRALGRQWFNYARGNGRVGIGTTGYKTNMQYHALILGPLLIVPWWPYALLLSFLALALHVRRHLWRQAQRAVQITDRREMLWRVLLVMEWVRLVGMAGFVAGRWDRWQEPRFKKAQEEWMGVASIEDLDKR